MNDRISELEHYLKVTGLNDYHLTNEDKEIINRKVKTKEFKIGNLFTFDKGNVDIQNKNINNKGCYFINSGLTNQGIKGKTDYPAKIFPLILLLLIFSKMFFTEILNINHYALKLFFKIK